MTKLIDHTGKVYGKLTVLRRGESIDKRNSPCWVCQCECGSTVTIRGYSLSTGNTKSCPYCKYYHSPDRSTHKIIEPSIYDVWVNVVSQFDVPVCREWKKEFTVFCSDMGPKPVGYSLNRVNPNGNYEPGNCRWVPLQPNLKTTSLIRKSV
jgi:hypothetical protein